nr:MAG TPA: hypothetical protein [Caudoviricetes sp.]
MFLVSGNSWHIVVLYTSRVLNERYNTYTVDYRVLR